MCGPTTERFDMIVLDLTDPDTPAFHLYSEEFFRMCQRCLKPGGLLTLHLGSPVYQAETVRKNAANLRKVFKHVAPLSLFIPLYGSQWCLAVASDTIDPRATSVETIAQRMVERRIDDLRFYHPAMHPALFTLPRFAQELTAPPPVDKARVAQLRAASCAPRDVILGGAPVRTGDSEEAPEAGASRPLFSSVAPAARCRLKLELMPLARFYVDDDLALDEEAPLPPEVAHHAVRVLRLREGAAITRLQRARRRIQRSLAHRGCARLGDTRNDFDPIERESPLAVTLVQAWVATDKLEWIVEKAVELGVAGLILVPTARSVVQLDEPRRDRRLWRLQEIIDLGLLPERPQPHSRHRCGRHTAAGTGSSRSRTAAAGCCWIRTRRSPRRARWPASTALHWPRPGGRSRRSRARTRHEPRFPSGSPRPAYPANRNRRPGRAHRTTGCWPETCGNRASRRSARQWLSSHSLKCGGSMGLLDSILSGIAGQSAGQSAGPRPVAAWRPIRCCRSRCRCSLPVGNRVDKEADCRR